MSVILFEDENYRKLLPLVHGRPVFDLRCGAFTQRERAALLASRAGGQQRPFGLGRRHLMGYYGPPGGLNALLGASEPLLLINGRALDLGWLPRLLDAPLETVFTTGGTLLGARLSPALGSIAGYYLRQQSAEEALGELARFARLVELDTPLLAYPWHLIGNNGAQIERDAALFSATRMCVPFSEIAQHHPHVAAQRPEQIFVTPGTRLDGPLALDARDGPILLDDAQIEPFSFIQGPAYIGPQAVISSARIRGATSIGPLCKIGGEVEASIVQGYSNKHHDGFLGHSFLGEWVNIGAMTTTSDLKNTYGSIRVMVEDEGQVDSGEIKLGCFLADHVKLGIGLHLNGGSVIGFGSNIFGIHSAPKTVPPFTWGGEQFREYRIDGMIGVARKVMSRRKLTLEPAHEALLREVFAMTQASRGALVAPDGPEPPGMALALARAEAEAVRA
jgi:UDP-N-acetylglucosamine diphosphorylase/glucosamine-1-phosphate N-acetyltransferase